MKKYLVVNGYQDMYENPMLKDLYFTEAENSKAAVEKVSKMLQSIDISVSRYIHALPMLTLDDGISFVR